MDYTAEAISNGEGEVSEVLNDFVEAIGYRQEIKSLEEKADEKIENINEFLHNIRQYFRDNPDSSLTDYLQTVTLTSAQDEIENTPKVNLMTVHTAKGLEFPYVFVAGMNDDVFPNAKAKIDFKRGGIEEERRLAFVAFTRAKKGLYVTYNHEYSYVTGEDKIASPFIREAGLVNSYKPSQTSNFRRGIYNISSNNNHEDRTYFSNRNVNIQRASEVKTSRFQKTTPTVKNNIEWHVNDICMHKLFGKGVVKRLGDGGTIVVYFESQGEKTLFGNHGAITKIEG